MKQERPHPECFFAFAPRSTGVRYKREQARKHEPHSEPIPSNSAAGHFSQAIRQRKFYPMSPHLMTSKPPRYCPARLKKFRPPANLLIFPICPSPQRYFIINQSRSKRWMSKSSGLIRKNRWSQVHHIQSGTVLSLPESSWSNKNLPGAIVSPPENPVRCFSSFWVMERWALIFTTTPPFFHERNAAC